jgi:hypothetical protein
MASLAGVTRLSLAGRRGPRQAYLFDPHRLAFPCWWEACHEGPPALLVTLDRHFDLVPPRAALPSGASLRAVDEYTRWELDPLNVDHILAAMDAGLIGDAIAIARASPAGAFTGEDYRGHRIARAPTLDRIANAPVRHPALDWIAAADRIVLDLDLDCFTSPSDADPTTVLPWPIEVIREFLRPGDPFWEPLLERCIALTVACEPPHCGGVVAADRLFADLAQVLFVELLGADLP